MPYGLDPTAGFIGKPASVIKTELDNAFKAAFGQSMGSEADGSIPAESPEGQFIGIIVDALSGAWDLAQATYAALDPAAASGAALDGVCAITGTYRDQATYSTVTAVCVGTAATVIPAGKVATVTGTGTRFALVGPSLAAPGSITIAALPAWATATTYAVGDLVKNGGKVYYCTVGGLSAAVGAGPATTGSAIVDNAATWCYIAAGTAAVAGVFRAEETGALAAVTQTLSSIATPVAGWTAISNPVDATLGQARETDAELRVRREAELTAQGNATVDAIRADVLRVDGVTSCKVFENTTMAVNADGLPAKSIEVLVEGGTDAAVGQAVWDSKPAGIETYGGTTQVVTDASGAVQNVDFTRPTSVDIWVDVAITYDASTAPSDLSDQVKAAIVAAGDALLIGYDVRAWPLGAALDSITGIIDVGHVYINTVFPAVASATITVGTRQRAAFDTARVSVTATPGTP